MSKLYQGRLESLTVGNVVNIALLIYKSNLQQYIRISFQSMLWSLAGYILPGGLILLGYSATNSWQLVGFLCLAWIGFGFYCAAKSLTTQAIISRLAYQELIDRPESLQEASKEVHQRILSFLQLNILANGRIGCYQYIIDFILFFIIKFMTNMNKGLGSLFEIAGLIIEIICLSFLTARSFISSMPLATERKNTAISSIDRSWDLTAFRAAKIQLIILTAFAITFPFQLILLTPVILLFMPLVKTLATSKIGWIVLLRPDFWLASGVFLVVLLLSSALVSPYWSALQAVIYYDLKNRHKGFNL